MNENTNNKATIAKPIAVIIKEAQETIISAINETKLNPVILEPIIKEIYLTVQQNANNEYIREKNEYEAALAQAEKENEEK